MTTWRQILKSIPVGRGKFYTTQFDIDLDEELDEPQPCKDRPSTSGRRLRTPDAARYLGISSWTLRYKAHHGEIPVLKEKYWLFDTRDLDKWLEASKEGGETL
jgi:hypothetical protein